MKKRLTFAEVLAKTEAINEHSVYVEELSGSIPYCDLTVEDFAEIYKAKDQDPLDLSVKVFCKAWHKADPTVTLEAVKTKIPLRIVLKVINELVPSLFQTGPLGILPDRRSAEQSTS